MRRLSLPLALLVLCLALPLAPALALTIAVDGNPTDWAPVSAVATDPDDAPAGQDIREVYYTNNTTTLFLRYDTRGTTTWTNPAYICFDTTDRVTGGQSPNGCGGLGGIDYRLTIRGTPTGPNNSLTTELETCNPGGQCNRGASALAAVLEAASAGTVTEVGVPLNDIGVTTSRTFSFTIATNVTGSGTNVADVIVQRDRALPGPTPVTLAGLTATREAGGVRVTWQTATEMDTVGYHVLRSSTGARADAAPITPELIPAEGDSVSGASYTFLDPSPPQGQQAHYWVEVWNADGSRDDYGPVAANPTVGNGAAPSIYLPLLMR